MSADGHGIWVRPLNGSKGFEQLHNDDLLTLLRAAFADQRYRGELLARLATATLLIQAAEPPDGEGRVLTPAGIAITWRAVLRAYTDSEALLASRPHWRVQVAVPALQLARIAAEQDAQWLVVNPAGPAAAVLDQKDLAKLDDLAVGPPAHGAARFQRWFLTDPEQRLALRRRIAERREQATAARHAGALHDARAHLEAAFDDLLGLGDLEARAGVSNDLGALALQLGELERAGQELRSAAELSGLLGDPEGLTLAVLNRAWVFLRAGDPEAAQGHAENVIAFARLPRLRQGLAQLLREAAELFQAQGSLAQAARCRELAASAPLTAGC
jgi:tetratricopeptide (TPR) repeat protein